MIVIEYNVLHHFYNIKMMQYVIIIYQMAFYLYVRENKYWNHENIYKIGITTNIPERHSQYIKHELEAGTFILVFEINDFDWFFFDNNFKDFFKEYNCYQNAGTEFYYRQIVPHIIPYFMQKDINYRMLSNNDIETYNSFYILY
jgi:hypothetical protein